MTPPTRSADSPSSQWASMNRRAPSESRQRAVKLTLWTLVTVPVHELGARQVLHLE